MVARYPLEAALILRRSERMRAEGELAEAQRACERGRALRQVASDALDAHVVRAPGDAASGQAGRRSTAVELQRAAAFAQHHALTTRSLRAALADADLQLAQAQAALQRAQNALGGAHAREQAVERDRERFEHAEQRAAEDAEEEEHAEQRVARRSDRPREH